MKKYEIIEAIQADPLLLTMITEEIGERTIAWQSKPTDWTWEDLGKVCFKVLASHPMDRDA